MQILFLISRTFLAALNQNLHISCFGFLYPELCPQSRYRPDDLLNSRRVEVDPLNNDHVFKSRFYSSHSNRQGPSARAGIIFFDGHKIFQQVPNYWKTKTPEGRDASDSRIPLGRFEGLLIQ